MFCDLKNRFEELKTILKGEMLVSKNVIIKLIN